MTHTPDTLTRLQRGMNVARCTACGQDLFRTGDGWVGDDTSTTTCPAGRVSEASPRTERVRVDELAVGDVIVASSGARETVIAVDGTQTIGPRRYRRIVTDKSRGLWRVSNRYDRLTEAAKRAAGYPAAEHDVPSGPSESVHTGAPGLHVL